MQGGPRPSRESSDGRRTTPRRGRRMRGAHVPISGHGLKGQGHGDGDGDGRLSRTQGQGPALPIIESSASLLSPFPLCGPSRSDDSPAEPCSWRLIFRTHCYLYSHSRIWGSPKSISVFRPELEPLFQPESSLSTRERSLFRLRLTQFYLIIYPDTANSA